MKRSELLAMTPLFSGSKPEEIDTMLGCLAARERRYGKGARIHRMGDVITTVGLVLEGSVRIESVDVWGNVSVLGVKGTGGMFGEAYAAVPGEPLMVDVVAAIIARQSLALSRRILHVAPKTIRGKVLAYLSDVAERAGKREFDIPFDRQQLADYLGVDRSALSAELSRMQKAGLIETRRSHFILK